MNVEEVSSVVVDTAFHLHWDLGPGLLESVYEAVLKEDAWCTSPTASWTPASRTGGTAEDAQRSSEDPGR